MNSIRAINFATYHAQGNDDIKNALRHTYWQALLSVSFGSTYTANLWAEAHEQGSVGSDPGDTCRDRYNNQIGQNVGTQFMSRANDEDQVTLRSDVASEILRLHGLGNVLRYSPTCG